MWRDVGKACRWRHPRAPAVRLLFKEKAIPALLDFLRRTRVGEIVSLSSLPEGVEDLDETEEIELRPWEGEDGWEEVHEAEAEEAS